MRITLEEAKALEYGDYIHMLQQNNADGTPVRWRISGKVKTWKRDGSKVTVPMKHGLYDNGYLTEASLFLFGLGDGL